MSELYLNKAQFVAELEKCLQCRTKPCKEACPVKCSPHDFIDKAKNGDMKAAAGIIARQNPFGETCGLICPDKFCMRACLRKHIDAPIRIPAVQAQIMYTARKDKSITAVKCKKANGKRIAVVGSGPAGMGAAVKLAQSGFAVTVYEKENIAGGALNLIPSERLPRKIIADEWQKVCDDYDLEIKLNTQIENYENLLNEGFAAVIVATGEQKSRSLGILGENLTVDFQQYLKNPQQYQTKGAIAVIGGGAAAVDCAVTATHQGAKHTEMFVRRALSNMRITETERKSLWEAQVDITTMTRVTKIEKNGADLTLYTCKTRFNNDNKLEDIPHTEIARGGFDYVILALGSIRNEEICESDKIFYAGDVLNGSSTAVEALASGQQTAEKVDEIFAV